MTDAPSTDGEPDDSPIPKHRKRGGKTIKAKGQKPHARLDKMARGGGTKAGGSGIHIKSSHKGLLHKDTGTPSGQKIPEKKIKKAENSTNPAVRKRAVFAENAKHWNK